MVDENVVIKVVVKRCFLSSPKDFLILGFQIFVFSRSHRNRFLKRNRHATK